MAKESAPGALLEGRNPDDPQDGAHGGCRVRSSGRRRSRDGPDRYLPANPFRRPDRDRAQTTQDFAVGVSIFLLVLAGTVAFLPNIFAPYDQQVGSVERQQAIRIADVLVSDDPYAVSGKRATLSYDDVESNMGSPLLTDLRERAGVPDSQFSVAIYTRPGLTQPMVLHENDVDSTSFEPDGSSPPDWYVVDPAVQIERFEMQIDRGSLPSGTPFTVEVASASTTFTLGLEDTGGQVTVTPSSGSCAVSTASDVSTVDIDFATGILEVTDVDGETDSCDVSTPLETDPNDEYSVRYFKGGGTDYPEGSYRIALAEAPAGLIDKYDDTSAEYPETSIVKLDGESELVAQSQPWNGQPSVTVSRFVSFDDPSHAIECKPVCELVVRVW